VVPEHTDGVVFTIVTEGNGFTVTVLDPTELQPAFDMVTPYVVVLPGETVIDWVVSPVLHE
jgi:hypothetical protein